MTEARCSEIKLEIECDQDGALERIKMRKPIGSPFETDCEK